MISQRKSTFLDKNYFFSYKLTACDLVQIRDHYEKQGMIIIINGETPYGQFRLDRKKRRLEAVLKRLRSKSLKYAAYVVQNWRVSSLLSHIARAHDFSIEKTFLPSELEVLQKAFVKFLTSDNKFRHLKREELVELNEICKQTINEEWLNTSISTFIHFLNATLIDICLTKSECVEEMKLLQITNEEKEAIGYIHTNNHRSVGGHFEVFIITRDSIIKPLDWPSLKSRAISNQALNFYYPYLGLPLFKKISPSCTTPCAQTQTLECGTLGMMYLKELLKDNARQLREFTLQIPYLSSDRDMLFFFFPSPHVLRYSQSNRFNKIIEAMLLDGDSVEVTYDQDKYEVYTIKKLLQDSLGEAKVKQKSSLVSYLEGWLADLPGFREKWLTVYHEMMVKRDKMTKEGTNHYLSYTTQRMEQIKDELVAEENPLRLEM